MFSNANKDIIYYLSIEKNWIINWTNEGKNRLYLKNWRPISLLNTDCKEIATILATRLQSVHPDIINDDQSGYLKGWYIGQNVRILEDVTFFTKQIKSAGILLTTDFEKAFDSFIWNSLKHLNMQTLEKLHKIYENNV